jgi:hypothetical protein
LTLRPRATLPVTFPLTTTLKAARRWLRSAGPVLLSRRPVALMWGAFAVPVYSVVALPPSPIMRTAVTRLGLGRAWKIRQIPDASKATSRLIRTSIGGWPRAFPNDKVGALPFSWSLREGEAFRPSRDRETREFYVSVGKKGWASPPRMNEVCAALRFSLGCDSN